MSRPIRQHEALPDPDWVNGPPDLALPSCPNCEDNEVQQEGDVMHNLWHCQWKECGTRFEIDGGCWTPAEWQAELDN